MANERVLVVDDDVFLRDFLKNRLTGEGYDVTVTPTDLPEMPAQVADFDLVLSHIEKPFSLGRLNRTLRTMSAGRLP